MVDKVKINLNIENIYLRALGWICAFYAFLEMYPYFIWDTYMNGSLYVIRQIFLLLTFIGLFFYFLHMKHITSKSYFIGASFILIWILQRIAGGKFDFAIGSIITVLIICIFVNLDDNIKKDVYNKFVTIYAISLISSIIIWFLKIYGVNIPYTELASVSPGKVARGIYYKHYFGSIYTDSIHFTAVQRLRLCGMFDEPGVVGTFSALILIGNQFPKKWKNWKSIVIFIAGVLSISLAFCFIVIAAYLFKSLKNGYFKVIITIIFTVISYFVFINIKTDNAFIKTLQTRLTFSNGELAGNNRTNQEYNIAFKKFLKGEDGNRLLGNGINATINNPQMYGSATYKMLIYEYGFIGFIAILLWFIISIGIRYRKNWTCMTLLFAFLLSIYQRPYVTDLYCMIILFGGCAFISNSQTETIRLEKNDVIEVVS